ncbi:MAG: hypothetical protein VXX30_08570, partial [Planctomycetota bacterium]|nr:hypothetical protein [Planctomycetota bacterium]
MKGAIWKPVLIVAIALLCVYSVIPPDQKIRLGKDLRGGVSLVYAVSVPEDANSEQVISQVIEVLKQRVNPQGVLDITFQPQGAAADTYDVRARGFVSGPRVSTFAAAS